ncbi:outer membrane transport energization protein TonB [Loktanella atrilutea]|uniref:Outer membrane transport energization protein TonB n=1 Tax=Loktanella atrilutea TaxID=366533 RepID=A0A1M4XK63_LOKAT|nr:TonB family protein [Loktanella atrilutea]SHE93602.1 outer membrane transport energization protein TonB [Loktanella atrilutea]
MRRPAEWLVFGSLAVALHLGALAAYRQEPKDGATSTGDGGEAMVSLEAASATVIDMVAEWDRPPEVTVSAPPSMPAAPSAPPMTAEAPPMAAPPDMSTPDIASPALPVAPQAPPPEPLPEAVTAAPSFAPQASLRPVNRPARPTPQPARQAPPAPAPQQAAPRPAAPAQRAAGQGSGAAAGTAGTSPAPTASAAQVQSLMARWGGEIRSRIERRKSYPRAAGGASGTVQVAIRVGADGQLRGLGIAGSSGNAALDQAALTAVQRAGRFPAAPAGIGGGAHSFTLPMAFNR